MKIPSLTIDAAERDFPGAMADIRQQADALSGCSGVTFTLQCAFLFTRHGAPSLRVLAACDEQEVSQMLFVAPLGITTH